MSRTITSIHNLAISDEPGVTTLNTNASPATNSLLPTDPRASSYWGEGLLETENCIDVGTTSIDAFCREKSISKIDILKLDIQGAEFLALTGAKGMLANESISMIYMEMIMAPTYKGQHKLHEYLVLLDAFGYELNDLYNPVRKNMQLIQADVLFVSTSIKKIIHEN